MKIDNSTIETLTGGEQPNVDPAVVKEAVTTSPPNAAETNLSLEEINAALGKDFKDKATALKSFKDTFSYVGRKVETPAPVDLSGYISKEQYETDMFYKDNPDYAKPEVRAIIDSMTKSGGKKPHEVVKEDSFKGVFDKIKGYDEHIGKTTILDSNPRLQGSITKLDEARTLQKEGKTNQAEAAAVEAVLSAYEK